ncbi:MAG TPA: tautomerase family protein [Thermoanaerobaculia bacterium]|nr:tautomerase family protein [Thermoanaerobaculia bacterium]
MPLVKIYLRSGKNEEYLRSMSEAIHSALVSEADVPADDRFQAIVELPHDRLVQHATYGGVLRSNDLIIVEVTLNVGRTVEIKKKLYARMASNLEKNIGLRSDDLLVSLVEVQKENWSFGKGVATYAD